MVKYSFPSHFLPRLNDEQQRELRHVIASRVVDINADLSDFNRAAYGEELNRVVKRLEADYADFQKNFFELCKTTNEQKTATLVSSIWACFSEIDGVIERLDDSRKNPVLFQLVVNYAASLLYRFKKSKYNELVGYVSELKQRIA